MKTLIPLLLLPLLFIGGCSVARSDMRVEAARNERTRVAIATTAVLVEMNRPELPDTFDDDREEASGTSREIAAVASTRCILFFTQKHCRACDQSVRQTLPPLEDAGWKIEKYGKGKPAHIFIASSEENEKLVRDYCVADENDVHLMPQWVAVVDGKRVGGLVGFATTKQIESLYAIPPPKQQAAVGAIVPRIQLHGVRDSVAQLLTGVVPWLQEGAIVAGAWRLPLPRNNTIDMVPEGDGVRVTFGGDPLKAQGEAPWWALHSKINGQIEDVFLTREKAVVGMRGLPDIRMEFVD